MLGRLLSILGATAIVFTATLLAAPLVSAIYGGSEVERGNWNGVVRIEFSEGQSCSATVIHPRILVTAAHCVQGSRQPESFKVQLHHKLSASEVKIEKMIKHPNYREGYRTRPLPSELNSDIMVVVTRRELTSYRPEIKSYKFVETVQQAKELIQNGNNYVVGFGDTNKRAGRNARPKRLQKVYPSYSGCVVGREENPNNEKDYCTRRKITLPAWLSTGTGLCKGDSGGGLYAVKNGEAYVVGVLSAVEATGCGNANSTSAHIVLSNHLCWIQRVSGINLNLTQCKY